MTKESIVLLLGVIVFILPHIGVPEDWKIYVFSVTGIILMTSGYSLRQKAYIRSIEKDNGERDTDSFMESTVSRNIDQSK